MRSENSESRASDNGFVTKWVLKTIFGFLAGVAVGFALAQFLFCSRSVANELWGAILLGAIVGVFVGIAQSSQMRDVVGDPRLWILATIAGWAMAAFLLEVNWPISRCVTSSNAPGYVPGELVRTIQTPIYVIAERMERMVEGETVYGGIYNTVISLLMGSLMGVTLGLPQGIAQWLVLRQDMPRSSIMIWVNVLIWTIADFSILFIVEFVNFSGFLVLMLLPVVLIQPAAISALALLWLQKKQVCEKRK